MVKAILFLFLPVETPKFNPMKKLSLFCIVALVLSACTKQQLPVASYDIIPQPKEVQLNEEKPFELSPKTLVYYEAGLQREAQFLCEYVNDIMGYALNMQEMLGNETKGIVLQLAPADFDQAEAYEINITPKQIRVKGADAAGVFYGIQTLRKSLPTSPSERGAGGGIVNSPLPPSATGRTLPIAACTSILAVTTWTWTR